MTKVIKSTALLPILLLGSATFTPLATAVSLRSAEEGSPLDLGQLTDMIRRLNNQVTESSKEQERLNNKIKELEKSKVEQDQKIANQINEIVQLRDTLTQKSDTVPASDNRKLGAFPYDGETTSYTTKSAKGGDSTQYTYKSAKGSTSSRAKGSKGTGPGSDPPEFPTDPGHYVLTRGCPSFGGCGEPEILGELAYTLLDDATDFECIPLPACGRPGGGSF